MSEHMTEDRLAELFAGVERARAKKDNPILHDFAETIHEARKLQADLATARAQVVELEQKVCNFQAAAMIDVGKQGGPCLVEPKHVEQHVTELRSQIAGLEAACAAKDEALRRSTDVLYTDSETAKRIRAALAITPASMREVASAREEVVRVAREAIRWVSLDNLEPGAFSEGATALSAYREAIAQLDAAERKAGIK